MILDNSYNGFERRKKYNTSRSSYYGNESGWVGKEWRKGEEWNGEERRGEKRRGEERRGKEMKGEDRREKEIREEERRGKEWKG